MVKNNAKKQIAEAGRDDAIKKYLLRLAKAVCEKMGWDEPDEDKIEPTDSGGRYLVLVPKLCEPKNGQIRLCCDSYVSRNSFDTWYGIYLPYKKSNERKIADKYKEDRKGFLNHLPLEVTSLDTIGGKVFMKEKEAKKVKEDVEASVKANKRVSVVETYDRGKKWFFYGRYFLDSKLDVTNKAIGKRANKLATWTKDFIGTSLDGILPDGEKIDRDFESKVKELQNKTLAELRKKVEGGKGGKPAFKEVRYMRPVRDPDYVAFAKKYAAGICQLCKKAPFEPPDKKGSFLDGHHIKSFGKGGLDELANMVALCPNCHRKMHISPSPKDKEILLEVAKYKDSSKDVGIPPIPAIPNA